MIHKLNKLIQKYQASKLESILNRFKYTECGSPLIVPVAFNKEHLEMMKLL